MSWSLPSAEPQRLHSSSSATVEEDAMVLDFKEAMETFRSMFPNLEMDVIEQVLRSHKGSVDSTIDSLLKISSSEHSGPSHSQAPKSFRAKQSYNDLNSDDVQDVTDLLGNTTLDAKSRWKPALLGPLPADFLNLSSTSTVTFSSQNSCMLKDLNSDTLSRRMRENEELRAHAASSCSDDGDLQGFLEDERIAIMLQNEEFLNILSQDEDFMESMSREQGFAGSRTPVPASPNALPINHPYFHESRTDELSRYSELGAFPYRGTMNKSSAGSSRSRLGPDMAKNMGHSTKVKLAKLAKKFFSRKGFAKGSKGLPHLSPDKSQATLSSTGQAPLLEDDELSYSSNSHNQGGMNSGRL